MYLVSKNVLKKVKLGGETVPLVVQPWTQTIHSILFYLISCYLEPLDWGENGPTLHPTLCLVNIAVYISQF